MEFMKKLFKRDSNALYDETPSQMQAIVGFLVGFLGYMYIFPWILSVIVVAIKEAVSGPILPEEVNFYNILIQDVCGIITLLIMFLAISFKKVRNIIKNINWYSFALSIMYFLISLALLMVWNAISVAIWGEPEVNANQSSINQLMSEQPVLTIMLTCLIAPLIEEMIFRYYLYKGLEDYNPVIAIVVTTFLFAFIHLGASISEGTFVEDLKTLPNYLIPSLIMTISYYKHHKLCVSVMTHMAFNIHSTIGFFLLQALEELESAPEVVETIARWITIIG